MAYRADVKNQDSDCSDSDSENEHSGDESSVVAKKLKSASDEASDVSSVKCAGRKKPNNIWADVVVEQQLSQNLQDGSANVQLRGRVARGPETYSMKKFSAADLAGNPLPQPRSEGDDDLFDAPVDLPETLNGALDDVGKARGRGRGRGGYGGGQKRTHSQQRGPGRHQKFPMIYGFKLDGALFEKELPSLAALLARALCEQKTDLMEKCLRELGVEKCGHWLSETEKLERKGGLMTGDNFRRRTPGGVFLGLLKQDANITEQQKEAIFGESQRQHKQILKARRHNRRASQEELVKPGASMDTDEKEVELKEKKQLILEEFLAGNKNLQTPGVERMEGDVAEEVPAPKTPPSSPHHN